MNKWRSFEQARKFAHSQKLDNRREWIEYYKSGKKPEDIPKRPELSYKNKGWKGWGDFLGTGTIAFNKRQYRPFKKARKFVHSLKLKDQKEWKQFASTNKCPEDIPSHPDRTYGKKEWNGMGDWLGTGNIHPKQRKYRSFTYARKFVHSLKFKNSQAWPEYCKSGKKPDDIPSTPYKIYKQEWNGMGDWLGTGNISNTKKSQSFLTPQKAGSIIQKLAKEYGLKNKADWIKFAKTHKKLLEKLHLPLEILRFYSLEQAKKRMKK